jgi:hypothetical protein
MNEKHWLLNYLEENYPTQSPIITAIQRNFSEIDKIKHPNILYFGFFSGVVTVENPFQSESINMSETHSRPFLFSNLEASSNLNEVFIGYEIAFQGQSKY